ncbi:MAG: hypothetical protein ACTSQS_06865 [Promethearchaeota archaeon]
MREINQTSNGNTISGILIWEYQRFRKDRRDFKNFRRDLEILVFNNKIILERINKQ